MDATGGNDTIPRLQSELDKVCESIFFSCIYTSPTSA